MAKRRGLRQLAVVLVILLAALVSVAYVRPTWFLGRFQDLKLLVSGVQSRKVLIDGHKIHYYVRGQASGPAVVLVHGLGGRAEDWEHLTPFLVRAGYCVYAPDLLGFGQSEEPVDASYSIPDQAALVVKFMDAVGLKQVDLAGWSMGGWVVQKAAVDHPERIRRLVLIDSVGLQMQPDWDTRLFTPTTPAELNQLDALLMPDPPKIPAFLAVDILRLSKEYGWVTKRALASMLSGKDVMDAQLPSLKMPVLILWGERDRIAPLTEGRAMHTLIPQSRLEIAPGCGHLAPEQCSDRLGPAMVEFLRSEPPLPAGEIAIPAH
jgi:pimeloyl-ACP methyl ester carboxylesterase